MGAAPAVTFRGGAIEPLAPRLVESLARPDAHPEDPSARRGLRWVQTHISHVYLSGARAYKLRKAVSLGFVDFSTRAQRNVDCVREVALNRRLAPDVYLGVAPVEATSRGFRIGPLVSEPGDALAADPREHVVVMRRLAAGRDALSLLARGALRTHHLDAVARTLAAFHARHRLGVPSPWSPAEWRERIERPVRETLEQLGSVTDRLVPRATWARTRARARDFAERHADAFEARRRAGRAVDGHGDVHLQHVWFEPGRPEPLLVDCIEFRDDLRQIDTAAEVAFLAMDLGYRGRGRWAARFLRSYAAEADDYDLYRVVDYYVSYRAAVRARVAALAADDPAIDARQRLAAAESAARHLALAERALAPRPAGSLVLVAGVVGTGKSTAAAFLADLTGGAVIASDRVRKQRAGLAPTERGGARAGLYDDAARDAVYAALLERAAPVLEGGRVAVLDATYAQERHRDAALRFARARGVATWIVETVCSPETARARLARRATLDQDPSDAGPERYAASAAAFEPLRLPADVGGRAVATDAPLWRQGLRAVAREIANARRRPAV